MCKQSVVLRHVTQIENMDSILRDNRLDAAYSKRTKSSDYGFAAFEEYTGSNFLEELGKLRSCKRAIFSLFFDKNRMQCDGIIFHQKDIKRSKKENFVHVGDKITQEEYEQIGEYWFVEDYADLKYLTNTCKSDLKKWAESNGKRVNFRISS